MVRSSARQLWLTCVILYAYFYWDTRRKMKFGLISVLTNTWPVHLCDQFESSSWVEQIHDDNQPNYECPTRVILTPAACGSGAAKWDPRANATKTRKHSQFAKLCHQGSYVNNMLRELGHISYMRCVNLQCFRTSIRIVEQSTNSVFSQTAHKPSVLGYRSFCGESHPTKDLSYHFIEQYAYSLASSYPACFYIVHILHAATSVDAFLVHLMRRPSILILSWTSRRCIHLSLAEYARDDALLRAPSLGDACDFICVH